MTLIIKDRVKETTDTTGTGTVNLSGAADGFDGFVAAIGDTNTTYYCIYDSSNYDWEVGIGTITDASPDTLSRDTVISSSNSGSLVDFSAGSKDVFCTAPASRLSASFDAPTTNGIAYFGSDGLIRSDGPTWDGTYLDIGGVSLASGNSNQFILISAPVTNPTGYQWSWDNHSSGPAAYGGAYKAGNDRYITFRGSGSTRLILEPHSGGSFYFESTGLGVNQSAPTGQLSVTSNDDARVGLIVKAKSPTTTADLFQAQASDGTVKAKVTSEGNLQAQNVITDSTSVWLGEGASGGDYCVTIGEGASGGVYGVTIGKDATGDLNSVVIGVNCRANDDCVAIGKNCGTTAALQSVMIGSGADANAFRSVAIGFGAQANQVQSIALGHSAAVSAANQFVAGASSYPINNVYFGKGVTNATPTAYTINGTGGSGTDIAGADIQIAGGRGTGSGAPGEVIFQVAPAGGSGDTLNALSDALKIDAVQTPTGLLYCGASQEIKSDGPTWDGSILNVGADKTLNVGGSGGLAVRLAGSGNWGWIKDYYNGTYLTLGNLKLGLLAGDYPSKTGITLGTSSVNTYVDGLLGVNEASPGAQAQITSGDDARVGLIVKGKSPTTTADLFQAQASDGTVLTCVDADGLVGVNKPTPSAQLHAAAKDATTVPFRVDGAASRSVDLFQIYDDTTKLLYIDQHEKLYWNSSQPWYGNTFSKLQLGGSSGTVLEAVEGASLALHGFFGKNYFYLRGNAKQRSDGAVIASEIQAGHAFSTATVNLVGGELHLMGGNGASGSSGDAHGGDIVVRGGNPYGTGLDGNTLLAWDGSAVHGNVGIGTATFDAAGVNVIVQYNGTAPSGGLTDAFQQYSADAAAGNACPHYVTEAGDIIKLYKTATGYTTFSNLSTDRTCDANSTTVEELADILGTLIEDLKNTGVIAA